MYYQPSLLFPGFRFDPLSKLLTLLIILSLLLQPLLVALPRSLPVATNKAAVQPVTHPMTVAPAVVHPTRVAAPTYALPAALVGKPEVTALRTADSATFDLGDGQFARYQDSMPLHYQDGNGAWHPIDPAFVQTPRGWVNATNLVRTAVDQQRSAAAISAGGIGETGVNLRWQPVGLAVVTPGGHAHTLATPLSDAATDAVQPQESMVRFANHWSIANLQDQWQSGAGTVEYTMQLASLPALPWWQATPDALDLQINLHLQPGTTLHLNGQAVTRNSQQVTRHPLTFVDASGAELSLLPPTTYEQANRTVSVAADYVVTVGADPAQIELRVRTPWAWLAAPERQFPVIIDPIFQMRGPTEAWLIHHGLDNLATPDLVVPSVQQIRVGRDRIGLWRGVVRFGIPRMPQGTVIDRAYLYAQPTGFSLAANNPAIPQNWLGTKLSLHEVTDSNWQGGWVNGQPLNYNPDPLDPDEQGVSFVESTEPRTGVRWEVTTQVSQWLVTDPNTPDVANHGLLLRSPQETCEPLLLPNTNYQNPFCGTVNFDVLSSSWSDLDLRNTQDSEDSNNPVFLPSTQGGLRLVVFYHNDTLLTLNGVKAFDLPGGGGTPPAGDPYYAADHLYKLPPLDDTMWQALVVRGLGQPQGQYPPPGDGFTYQRPLQGQLELALMSNNDKLQLRGITAAQNGVGYILFNGAGTPISAFDQQTLVRVGGVGNAEPSAYDIRLHPTQSTISTILTGTEPKVGPQTLPFSFDSANPIGLWNLTMPIGANSRVKIRIHTDSTYDDTFLKQYANRFQARLVRSDQQGDLLSDRGVDEEVAFMEIVQNPATGEASLLSPIFPVQSGKWALVLTYNGPHLESWTVPDCEDEVCSRPPSRRVPIKYGMEISVHSCKDGEFPTANGQCQKVICPTAGYPANTPEQKYYDEANGMAVWSEAGWDVNGAAWTSKGNNAPAPLLGPP